MEVQVVGKKAAQQIANKIKELEESAKEELFSLVNRMDSDLDILEDLAVLKERGIITEEEFAAKKKSVLGI